MENIIFEFIRVFGLFARIISDFERKSSGNMSNLLSTCPGEQFGGF